MSKNLVPFTDAEERFINKVINERARAEKKFPLITGLLITLGFVSTLYGFEKLIDRVDLFVNNPWLLLTFGIGTLLATGAAYTKLH